MIQWAQVTALYAGILGLMLVVYSFQVTRERRRCAIGLGDGGDARLRQASRAQANFTEYVPLTLLLLALYEMNGGFVFYVHVMGAALVIARLLHAWGLSQSEGVTFGRYYGTAVTWLVLGAAATANIIQSLT